MSDENTDSSDEASSASEDTIHGPFANSKLIEMQVLTVMGALMLLILFDRFYPGFDLSVDTLQTAFILMAGLILEGFVIWWSDLDLLPFAQPGQGIIAGAGVSVLTLGPIVGFFEQAITGWALVLIGLFLGIFVARDMETISKKMSIPLFDKRLSRPKLDRHLFVPLLICFVGGTLIGDGIPFQNVPLAIIWIVIPVLILIYTSLQYQRQMDA